MGAHISPYAVLAQRTVCHPTKMQDLGSNPKHGASGYSTMESAEDF